MIQPTRRAVVLMAAGAPMSLILGVAAPGLWPVGLAWILFGLALVAIDAALAAPPRNALLSLEAPVTLSVNGQASVRLRVAFSGRAPAAIEATLDTDRKLRLRPAVASAPVMRGVAEAPFTLTPVRRGAAPLPKLWARWVGPLGLTRRQAVQACDHLVSITPDIEGVKSEAVRLFSRDGLHGLKTQLDAGQGAEFHALREFQPGMDTRTIDWKQSARHRQLLAREYRAERNHPVILAVDTGRSMGEPVGSLARLDWALNAALLLAYVSLRMGDRVGLYAFDAKPRLISGTVAGERAFPALEKLAARVDYSTEETNYALGLFTLSGELERRSLVVVFTEFADTISAELMIDTVQRLLTRHLVLFVVIQDQELKALREAEPTTPPDVSRAVIAASLLRDRELVLVRLRRMGVEIVDAPARHIRAELLDRYVALKRRDRL